VLRQHFFGYPIIEFPRTQRRGMSLYGMSRITPWPFSVPPAVVATRCSSCRNSTPSFPELFAGPPAINYLPSHFLECSRRCSQAFFPRAVLWRALSCAHYPYALIITTATFISPPPIFLISRALGSVGRDRCCYRNDVHRFSFFSPFTSTFAFSATAAPFFLFPLLLLASP